MDLVTIVIPIGIGIKKNQFEIAIDSVLNQTYKDLEILLVFQKNHKLNYIESLIKKYEKLITIRFIIQSGQGIGNARREGIDNSNGKYICMFDADDEMVSNKIQIQLNVIRATNADVLFSNALKNLYSDDKKYTYRNQQVSRYIQFKDLHFINVLYASTVMFKAEIVKEINYGEQKCIEDYNLWLRLLINKKKIYYLDMYLVTINYDEKIFQRRSRLSNVFAEIEIFKLKNTLSKNYTKNLFYTLISITYFLLPPIFKFYFFKIQHKNIINN